MSIKDKNSCITNKPSDVEAKIMMMAIKADINSTTFSDNKTGNVYSTILLLLVLKQGTTYGAVPWIGTSGHRNTIMQHWVQPMQIGFPNVATILSNKCVKQCDKILLPMLQNTTLGEIPNVAHSLPMLPKNTTKIGDTIVATHLKGADPLLHPNVAMQQWVLSSPV
jgi:hypothetical protein